jgi:hypothetical protein
MISLLAYISIAFMGLLVMPKWSNFPYTLPRQVFVTVAPFLLFGLWMFIDQRLALNPMLVLPMVAFWFFRSVASKRPEISFETMLPFTGCLALGAYLAGPEYRTTGIIIIACVGTANAVYAIVQKLLKINLLKFIEHGWNPYGACGFTRNAGVLGPYLVATFFFTMSLVEISPNFVFLAGLQVFAIYLTDNRTSLVSLGAGCLYLGLATHSDIVLEVIGVVSVALIAFVAFRFKRFTAPDRIQSAKERLNFLKIFWFAFSKNPLLGLGFNVVKIHIPYVQRELNRASNGKFMDPKNYNAPVVRKVHNDLLQHLLDVGLVGTVITLATIYTGITDQNSFAMAVVISFIVGGIFFHNSYWLPTQCLFWLAFGILAQGAYVQYAVPVWAVGCWLAVGYLVYYYVAKEMVFDLYEFSILHGSGFTERKIKTALALQPHSSIFLFAVATEYAFKNKDYESTVTFFRRAIEHYDGETTMWSLFSNLANAYFYAGSPILCKMYHELALSFYPYSKVAKDGLKFVESILDSVNWKEEINPNAQVDPG